MIAFNVFDATPEFKSELAHILINEDLAFNFLEEYLGNTYEIDFDDTVEVREQILEIIKDSIDFKVEFSLEYNNSQEPVNTFNLEKFLEKNKISHLIITDEYFSRRDSLKVPASAVFIEYDSDGEKRIFASKVVKNDYSRNRYFPYVTQNEKTPAVEVLESILMAGLPSENLRPQGVLKG